MIVAAHNPLDGIVEQGDCLNTVVFFDGVKQDDCIYADDVLGLIKILVFDERDVNGVTTYSRPRIITRRGRVTLITHKIGLLEERYHDPPAAVML